MVALTVTGENRVRPVTAPDAVAPGSRKQHVGAAIPEEVVRALHSSERVVASRAFEALVPFAAEDEIVAVRTVNQPDLRLLVDDVGPSAPVDVAAVCVAQD